MDEYLTRATAFGFTGTVLVGVGNTPILHKGYGFAVLASKQPNTTRTIYDIGSITKPLTAMGVLLLESKGTLSVDDSISRFFSGIPTDKQNIQIKHLLTHTSGIVDPPLGDYDPITRDELVKLLLAAPLGADIGTTYQYSNTGFSMLAAIIEKTTGHTYETYMREHLFLPAGMQTTGYVLPHWEPGRVAHTYTVPIDHRSPLDRLRAARGPGWILMGNGGVLGTTGDLFRWELALRKGSVVPAAYVAMAFQPHFQRSPREAVGYDWRITTSTPGEVSYDHGSDAPSLGLNGFYGRYPARDATIVLLANNRLNGASTRHFVVAALQKLLAGDAVSQPPLAPTPPSSTATAKMVDGVFGLDQDNEIIVKSTPDGVEVGFVGQSAVDLVNARQGPEAVAEAQRLTRRAAEFLTQLERQDRERLQEYVGTRERTEGFLSEWRAALGKRGPLKNSTVLGTVRLDRNAFVTTVRLAFDKGPIVVRFGWRLDKVAGNSDDLMLSSLAGPLRLSPVPFAAWSPYWYAANDTLFTFDLLTSTSLEATIIKRDGRVTELRFDTVPGNAGRWRRR
jgi:CubicO group peptidase (beta-lactamase class C family)